MSLSIRPMVAGDAELVAACARAADIDEIKACSGLDILPALELCMPSSLRAWVIESGGLPLAAVGDSLAGIGIGIPWMVTTNHIGTNRRGFLRASRAIMVEMLQRHTQLVNYVDERNTDAIRWLEWLGAEVGPAVPYGVSGLPFRRFTKQRSAE